MSDVWGVLGFATIPAVAIILGAFVATMRTPNARTQSMVQHFAAGVVFAAVAGEVLPDLHDAHAPVPTVVGFAIGVAVMLLVKHLVERAASSGDGAPRTAKSLLIVVLVDVVIDGILVGVGFAAGKEKGILIMVALTIEVLFLGLATIGELLEAGATRARAMGMACFIASLLLADAAVGAVLSALVGGALLVGLLAFSAAALLYLVTEELLVEAHETPETPLSTAVFFVGFIVLFLVESAV